MALNLDSKIPSGPIEQKWDKAKFDMKLVNPSNKRKYASRPLHPMIPVQVDWNLIRFGGESPGNPHSVPPIHRYPPPNQRHREHDQQQPREEI